mmetsp:Transcript_131094/g.355830  ORF Transcript_131094/g.355830 Transcript_131094/m.355830 type:complete len:93 (-) Transcript_131094:102-380(-)
MGSAARKASSVARRTCMAEEGLGVGGQSAEGVAVGDESSWRRLLAINAGGFLIEGVGNLRSKSQPGIASGRLLGAWPRQFKDGLAHERPWST